MSLSVLLSLTTASIWAPFCVQCIVFQISPLGATFNGTYLPAWRFPVRNALELCKIVINDSIYFFHILLTDLHQT